MGGFAYAYAAGGSPYSDGSYNFEWYNTNWGSITVGDSISNLGVGDYFLEVTDHKYVYYTALIISVRIYRLRVVMYDLTDER